MLNRRIASALLTLALLASPLASQAVLEITLDSGTGTTTFTDTDEDGSVEFDTIVGGTFEASGRVTEDLVPLRSKLLVRPLDPNPAAIFRNLSASPQTFSVTVRSATSPTPVAAPLGWSIGYFPTADDLTDMNVDIPAHSIVLRINDEAVTLGTLVADALTSTTEVSHSERGVDFDHPADDLSFVWTFTLGANDELRVSPRPGGFDETFAVSVFNQKARCVRKMTGYAGKMAGAALKTDARCIRETGMDVTSCVDAPVDASTTLKVQKLASHFATRCDPLPAWGVDERSCCVGGTESGDTCVDSTTCGGGDCLSGTCIAAAAHTAANSLMHDVFGPTVTISADDGTARCQTGATGTLIKLFAGMWKEFSRCTQVSFLSIADDIDLNTQCIAPWAMSDSEIDELRASAAESIEWRCVNDEVPSLGAVFPGACSAATDEDYSSRLIGRAACRFCESANSAAAIDPEIDCDLFDDGLSNATCP